MGKVYVNSKTWLFSLFDGYLTLLLSECNSHTHTNVHLLKYNVLDFTTSDISALANEDYEPKHQLQVTVNAGQSDAVNISIWDDYRVEGDETFQVAITGADAGEGIKIMTILVEDEDGKAWSILA